MNWDDLSPTPPPGWNDLSAQPPPAHTLSQIRDTAMAHLPQALQGYASQGYKGVQNLMGGLQNQIQQAGPPRIQPTDQEIQQGMQIGQGIGGFRPMASVPVVAQEAPLVSQAIKDIGKAVAPKVGGELASDFNARVRGMVGPNGKTSAFPQPTQFGQNMATNVQRPPLPAEPPPSPVTPAPAPSPSVPMSSRLLHAAALFSPRIYHAARVLGFDH